MRRLWRYGFDDATSIHRHKDHCYVYRYGAMRGCLRHKSAQATCAYIMEVQKHFYGNSIIEKKNARDSAFVDKTKRVLKVSSASYNYASLRLSAGRTWHVGELGCPKIRYYRVHLRSYRGPRLSCNCHHGRSSLPPEKRGNRSRELQPSLLQRIVVCYYS